MDILLDVMEIVSHDDKTLLTILQKAGLVSGNLLFKRKERNFVIQWGDKEVNVTLDRLKPAQLLGDNFEDITPETSDSEMQVQVNSHSDVAVHRKRTTRSGRVVRFPERF
ncbi:hypothetical protein NQ314_018863 [Rhamnusium bicolor]|uniref:Uncharacterized protein n=1 Tax=Rhamnusium bicolor TaxID=1586634 RepID=A0AAV8WPQ1_9CUCU|nr:hypothetical protein NQ314_018863 [Rhamnusium bicolor]